MTDLRLLLRWRLEAERCWRLLLLLLWIRKCGRRRQICRGSIRLLTARILGAIRRRRREAHAQTRLQQDCTFSIARQRNLLQPGWL